MAEVGGNETLFSADSRSATTYMKVIIAGSRDIIDPGVIFPIIERSPFEIDEVVCGMARGVDRMGRRWAIENGIPIKEFPANWGEYGNAAGPIRNGEMADYADALIAIWDGQSRGTADMISRMKIAEKPVWVQEVLS